MKVGIVGKISTDLLMAITSIGVSPDRVVVINDGSGEDCDLKISDVLPVDYFNTEKLKPTPQYPAWEFAKGGKSGFNKSDRKRNRKNRWR